MIGGSIGRRGFSTEGWGDGCGGSVDDKVVCCFILLLYCYQTLLFHLYIHTQTIKPYKKPPPFHHEKYNCIICLASEFSCPAVALVIHSLNSV